MKHFQEQLFVNNSFKNNSFYTADGVEQVTKEVVYPTVYFTRNTIPAKFMDQMYNVWLTLSKALAKSNTQKSQSHLSI